LKLFQALLALDYLQNLGVGLIHGVFGRELAAIGFGEKDAEGILYLIPARRAWSGPGCF
jgi:hypothetical protein